jgi:hypothetical protein
VSTAVKEEKNGAAKLFSAMINETSDIQSKSQLSTVLHCLSASTICEWSVGFTDVSSENTSDFYLSRCSK